MTVLSSRGMRLWLRPPLPSPVGLLCLVGQLKLLQDTDLHCPGCAIPFCMQSVRCWAKQALKTAVKPTDAVDDQASIGRREDSFDAL